MRQVRYAVAPRIAATSNSASGWAQVTIGAVSADPLGERVQQPAADQPDDAPSR